MKIMRHLRFAVMTMLACMGHAFDYAIAKPASFIVRHFERAFDLPAVGLTRLSLALAKWRTESQSSAGIPLASLTASSNHFVMSGTFSDRADGEVGWSA